MKTGVLGDAVSLRCEMQLHSNLKLHLCIQACMNALSSSICMPGSVRVRLCLTEAEGSPHFREGVRADSCQELAAVPN